MLFLKVSQSSHSGTELIFLNGELSIAQRQVVITLIEKKVKIKGTSEIGVPYCCLMLIQKLHQNVWLQDLKKLAIDSLTVIKLHMYQGAT